MIRPEGLGVVSVIAALLAVLVACSDEFHPFCQYVIESIAIPRVSVEIRCNRAALLVIARIARVAYPTGTVGRYFNH